MSVLTAPGAPFEIIEGIALGRTMRMFRHAPANMVAFSRLRGGTATRCSLWMAICD
ncbi:MAG: hypothetical protein ACREEJ_12135 [Ensifer adhaerens]